MTSKLEQLPLEILNEIAGYLSPYKDAFSVFSALSSRCHAACEPFQFSHLRIRAFSRTRLALDVEKTMAMLNINDRYRHVRSIKVLGTMPSALADDGRVNAIAWRYRSPLDHRPNNADIMNDDMDPGLWDHRLTMDDIMNGDLDRGLTIQKDKHDIELAFRPLLTLLSEIPNLLLFEFHSKNPLPLTVLRVLNSFHDCKLTLFNFRIQKALVGLSEDERELVESPCLYAITAGPDDSYANPRYRDFLGEAIQHLASGLSPNLAQVSIFHQRNPDSDRTYVEWGDTSPTPLWTGIPRMPQGTGTPALQTLNIVRHGPSFASWLFTVDYKTLRSLTVDVADVIRSSPSSLLHLLRNGPEFTSLKALELRGTIVPDHILSEFLENVKKLSSVSLELMSPPASLFAALETHVSALEDLTLVVHARSPDDFQRFIDNLSMNARQLVTVDLKLDFELDDWDVVEPVDFDGFRIYAALGRLPRLRQVSLCFRVDDDLPFRDYPEHYLPDLDLYQDRLMLGTRFFKGAISVMAEDNAEAELHSLDLKRAVCQLDVNLRVYEAITEARLAQALAFFEEMAISRAQVYPERGWPLESMRIKLLGRGATRRNFDFERKTFALGPINEELAQLHIRDLGKREEIAGFWPFAPTRSSSKFYANFDDPEDDPSKPGLHDYLRSEGLLPARRKEVSTKTRRGDQLQ